MADAADTAEWRRVQGFPDYEVSDDGRVRRATALRDGREYLIGREKAPFIGRTGYPTVVLFHPGSERQKTLRIHRLVAEAFLGRPPSPVHQVAHTDGNRSNNSVDNLRWVTAKENAQDRETHGRTARGCRVGTSRLTPEIVRAIRAGYASGLSIEQAGAALGVTKTTARRVVRRIYWRHVA